MGEGCMDCVKQEPCNEWQALKSVAQKWSDDWTHYQALGFYCKDKET